MDSLTFKIHTHLTTIRIMILLSHIKSRIPYLLERAPPPMVKRAPPSN